MTISVAELQAGASALSDVAFALSFKLANMPADQAVVLDALQIAALFDPALAPLVVIEPLAEALLAWVIANNQSTNPGALPHIASGARGGADQAEQKS